MSNESIYPVEEVFGDLNESLIENNVIILKAEPGAGKTTRVPIEILRQSWLNDKKIIVLEPRRLAARQAAEYMSSQINEQVGSKIGYRVRLDSNVSSQTRIEIITEAMLTGMLLKDPELTDVGCVIFDEFHERHLASDVALGMILEMREHYRNDLRLILMSATMDESQVIKRIPKCKVLESKGRQFPLEIEYETGPESSPEINQVVKAIKKSLMNDDGDILVFLPGVFEIKKVVERCNDITEKNVDVFPLYGQLNYSDQQKATRIKNSKQRSVIIATDIAETSLTIPGVRVVIDTGFVRQSYYEPNSSNNVLRLIRISKDSADQRAGRAGREGPGRVYRLWSRARHNGLKPMRDIEIEHGDLERTVLEVTAWGSTYDSFPWITKPSAGRWQNALLNLQSCGAVNNNAVSKFGEKLLKYPMEPNKAALLIIGIELNCGFLAALLITWWQSKDISKKGIVDLELRLNEFYREIKRKQTNDYKELKDLCKKSSINQEQPDFSKIEKLVLRACPERIAMRRSESSSRYILAQGNGVQLGKESEYLAQNRFLFCPVLNSQNKGEARVFTALKLDEECVLKEISKNIILNNEVYYDEQKNRVVALNISKWLKLELSSEINNTINLNKKKECFWNWIIQQDVESLPISKNAKGWLNRYEIYCEFSKLKMPLTQLSSSYELWLQPYIGSITSLNELSDMDWLNAIKSISDHEQLKKCDELVPPSIIVPSGSIIPVDYSDKLNPIIAVRIQEVFGMNHTPLILNGQLKLRIHLLSPARRTVQITSDLESFWKNGYFEVRKELKIKYPKHAWPEDPMNAKAVCGVIRSKKGRSK